MTRGISSPQANADILRQDAAGWPPLFYAARHGGRELLVALQRAGADLTFCTQIPLVIHGRVQKGTSKFAR